MTAPDSAEQASRLEWLREFADALDNPEVGEPRPVPYRQGDPFFEDPLTRFVWAARRSGRDHTWPEVDRWEVERCIVDGCSGRLSIRVRDDDGSLSFTCSTDGCAHPAIAAAVPGFEARWLPPREPPRSARFAPGTSRRRGPFLPASTVDDVLKRIPPAEWFEALTGEPVPPSGKVRCQFHPDPLPSMKLYPTGDRGWHCFAGCGSGSIIDFAARLWGLEPRGEGYREIKARLIDALLGVRAA